MSLLEKTPLPNSFADFRGRHAGASIVVCGCGRSLLDLPEKPGVLTLGVNDVGRHFTPDYLVVLNPPRQFSEGRYRWVLESAAQAVFSQLDVAHPKRVAFHLGRRGGVAVEEPDRVPYTRNSPYVAACIAAHLGAARIGLIGVDFTDHHFFGDTGRHELAREVSVIDRQYGRLAEHLAQGGVELVNLSSESRLASLPKIPLKEFLARPPARPRAVSWKPLIAIENRRSGVVGKCLQAAAEGARRRGFRVTRNLAAVRYRPDVVSVVWNGRRHRSKGPTLFLEHGWLPRAAVQVSHRGINASSHHGPFTWSGQVLGRDEQAELDQHLATLRAECRPKKLRGKLPKGFYLVPLQIEGDTNLVRHAPAELRRMQGLIDTIARAAPPLPVVFKQHPADARKSNSRHLRLRLRRRQDLLFAHARGSVHDLLASGRCRGILSINSNVVHDGLLWDVPAAVLGDNLWPMAGDSPFHCGLPKDWGAFDHSLEDTDRRACRAAYAHFLMTRQWTVAELTLGQRLAAAVETLKPKPRRLAGNRRPGRSAPAQRPVPRINVVAVNRGWLFEDLKQHFASHHRDDLRIHTSDRPWPSADAWIFLRAQEAATTPNPARTVVQLHDLFEDRLYDPGHRRRRALERSAGWVLTHPEQRRLLSDHGLLTEGQRVLLRPLGAHRDFRLRESLGDHFTVGWCGRPVERDGVDLKRCAWLVDCLRQAHRQIPGLRALLIGERLEAVTAALDEHGVPYDYHHRRGTPFGRYPELYRQLDVLLVTSRLAAGPNSLFEALASGVPVVSTAAGWSPRLLQPEVNGALVESPAEMSAAIARIANQREQWFERRQAIRDSLGGYSLGGWIDANLDLARSLL
ncbi:MAG: glycosyltransferase [Acidobacteriota bacterium]